MAAVAAIAALVVAPSAAHADRPLAKRTFETQRAVAGPCDGSLRQVTVRLPRRAVEARLLRPKVGAYLPDIAFGGVGAVVEAAEVIGGGVVFDLAGKCTGDPYVDKLGWDVELQPLIRYQRRERIFVTSNDGVARARPRTMYVGASQRFLNLRWRDWGQRVAQARGTFPFNDCIPYCAKGTITNRPMRVALSRPRMCASRLQYTRVTYRVASGPRQGFSTRYVC